MSADDELSFQLLLRVNDRQTRAGGIVLMTF